MTAVGAMSISLAAMRRGERGVLTSVESGGGNRCSAMEERMAAMGFIPGVEVEVEANYGRGPVIVCVRGARVALGRGQARRLTVRPVVPDALPAGKVAGVGGQAGDR